MPQEVVFIDSIEELIEPELRGIVIAGRLFGDGVIDSSMPGLLARREGIPGPHLVVVVPRYSGWTMFSTKEPTFISVQANAQGEWEIKNLNRGITYFAMVTPTGRTQDISSAVVDSITPMPMV